MKVPLVVIRCLLLVTALGLLGCQDSRLDKYERHVQEADGIEIYYKNINRTFTVAPQEMANFKNLLMRNVKPQDPKSFTDDIRIDLYRKGELTSFLLITMSHASPNCSFNSKDATFGFQLPYGIGMAISERGK